MQDLNEFVEEFITSIKKASFVENSVKAFSGCFRIYQEEYTEEFIHYFPNFQDDWLDIQVNSISYREHLLDNPSYEVIVSLRISYKGEDIARYAALWTFSGEWIDDFFYIIPSKL